MEASRGIIIQQVPWMRSRTCRQLEVASKIRSVLALPERRRFGEQDVICDSNARGTMMLSNNSRARRFFVRASDTQPADSLDSTPEPYICTMTLTIRINGEILDIDWQEIRYENQNWPGLNNWLRTCTARKNGPIRIGILGCANIARKLSRAISLASPDAVVHAVASRSVDKARHFAASNNLPASTKLYGSYEELLDDPEVEAVYVPLPTALHVEWAVLAARKKKHILLEKPVAMSLDELDRILEACQSNGVQFMDGTMWVHHPRTKMMQEFFMDENRFGCLKNIQTIFTFPASDDFLENDIRVKPELDGLGSLGDAGWYCIRATLLAANFELPKLVTALRDAVTNDSGVILSCGASLLWPKGVQGTIHCSFLSHLTMDITATGTKGTLRIKDFIVPEQENVATFTTNSNASFRDLEIGWFPVPGVQSVRTEIPQEALMVKEFSRLVRGVSRNGAEPGRMWPVISRKTQAVIDAVRESIKRGYEPVEVVY